MRCDPHVLPLTKKFHQRKINQYDMIYIWEDLGCISILLSIYVQSLVTLGCSFPLEQLLWDAEEHWAHINRFYISSPALGCYPRKCPIHWEPSCPNLQFWYITLFFFSVFWDGNFFKQPHFVSVMDVVICSALSLFPWGILSLSSHTPLFLQEKIMQKPNLIFGLSS